MHSGEKQVKGEMNSELLGRQEGSQGGEEVSVEEFLPKVAFSLCVFKQQNHSSLNKI